MPGPYPPPKPPAFDSDGKILPPVDAPGSGGRFFDEDPAANMTFVQTADPSLRINADVAEMLGIEPTPGPEDETEQRKPRR